MGHRPEFHDRLGRMRAGPDFLDRIRPAELALYAGTMSFEACTPSPDCHWLRLVSPVIDEPQHWPGSFLGGGDGALHEDRYAAVPAPELLDEWRSLPLPDDRAIAAAAVASDVEHDHSLVFSAFEEFRYTGDRLYKGRGRAPGEANRVRTSCKHGNRGMERPSRRSGRHTKSIRVSALP